MISKKQLRTTLREALDAADPNQVEYPAIKRERITYPIGRFQHHLKTIVTTYPQLTGVSFIYDEEVIAKERTVCIFKTARSRIRLTFEHQKDRVTIFVVGKDFDGVTKNVHLNNLVEAVGEFLQQEKVVSKAPEKPVDEPKKPVVKKKVIIKKKAIIKPSVTS